MRCKPVSRRIGPFHRAAGAARPSSSIQHGSRDIPFVIRGRRIERTPLDDTGWTCIGDHNLVNAQSSSNHIVSHAALEHGPILQHDVPGLTEGFIGLLSFDESNGDEPTPRVFHIVTQLDSIATERDSVDGHEGTLR